MINVNDKIKVSFLDTRFNNKSKNQMVISINGVQYFQSFESIIAVKDLNRKQVVLDRKYWNFSRTTSRYRIQFLGESTVETRKKIDSGIYQLANLN